MIGNSVSSDIHSLTELQPYFGILIDQLHVSGTADLEARVAAVRQQLATKQRTS